MEIVSKTFRNTIERRLIATISVPVYGKNEIFAQKNHSTFCFAFIFSFDISNFGSTE